MAGTLFFSDGKGWDFNSATVFYVLEFLISELPNGDLRDQLRELVDNNIPLLDLSEPNMSGLVDRIADSLPLHLESIEDASRRETLKNRLSELVRLAQEQQTRNAHAPE